MASSVGESHVVKALRLDFGRRLIMQLRGSVVTSDAELLGYREFDDALGISEMASDELVDIPIFNAGPL